MDSSLQNNTIKLQNILNTINTLPDAGGGVKLPVLTNEGASSDLMFGKQLINSDGGIVTGSFTIDSEITAQDTLIASIKSALQGKVAGGGSDSASIDTCTVDLCAPIDIELSRLIYSDGSNLVDFFWDDPYSRYTLTVAKNSILYIGCVDAYSVGIEGNGELVHNAIQTAIVWIGGDCSIDWEFSIH